MNAVVWDLCAIGFGLIAGLVAVVIHLIRQRMKGFW